MYQWCIYLGKGQGEENLSSVASEWHSQVLLALQQPRFVTKMIYTVCPIWTLNKKWCSLKVGVNRSLKREMWLLMDLITKKPCAKMYKSIHFWNQKNQMNPMVATDFCKIMRFSWNSSVTMVTIEFFLDSITKIWFY